MLLISSTNFLFRVLSSSSMGFVYAAEVGRGLKVLSNIHGKVITGLVVFYLEIKH